MISCLQPEIWTQDLLQNKSAIQLWQSVKNVYDMYYTHQWLYSNNMNQNRIQLSNFKCTSLLLYFKQVHWPASEIKCTYVLILCTWRGKRQTEKERRKTHKNKILIFTSTFKGHLVPSFLYLSHLVHLTQKI